MGNYAKCRICGFRMSPDSAKAGETVCKMCIKKGLDKEEK